MNLKIFLFTAVLSALQCIPTHASPNNLELDSGADEITMEWVSPETTPGRAGKYELVELGFLLEEFQQEIMDFKTGLNKKMNPFDPEVFNCYVLFTHEQSKSVTRRNAFYFEDHEVSSNEKTWRPISTEFPWRARFSPNELGRWSAVFYAEIAGKKYNSETVNFEVYSTDKSGKLKAGERYLEFEDTGKQMFTAGNNLYSAAFGDIKPIEWEHYRSAFKELANSGGNFTRIELGANNGLPDWNARVEAIQKGKPSKNNPTYDDYFPKMAQMWEFDRVIDICDKEELYFIIFRHHTEIGVTDFNDLELPAWDGISWIQNPYKVHLNLSSRLEYFTNKEAIKWQNNCLRYIFARWGYTPKFTFYGHSEIDGWAGLIEKNENGDVSKKEIEIFHTWVDNQKKYIKNELYEPKMMFVNTYMGEPGFELRKGADLFYANDDVAGFHKYTDNKAANYFARFDIFLEYRKLYNKPILHEEAGFFDVYTQFDRVRCCTSIDFENMIWGSSMMGAMGTSMAYWWPSLYSGGGHLEHYKPLITFMQAKLKNSNYDIYRWKDVSLGDRHLFDGKWVNLWNTSIENYNMVNVEKTEAIGWVHNATHHWRNYENNLPCISQIVNNSGVLEKPCIRGNGTKGPNHPIDKSTYDYNTDLRKDGFTDSGGARDLGEDNQSVKRPNVTFTIKGLKSSVSFASRHFYKVEFYYTRSDGSEVKMHSKTEFIKTDFSGNLDVPLPLLDFDNPSLAYVVTYIGKGSEVRKLRAKEK